MEIPTQPKENMAPSQKIPSSFRACTDHPDKKADYHCPRCCKRFCRDCVSGVYCPSCGAPLITSSELPPLKHIGLYAILAILFGHFGVHEFYAGHTKVGMSRIKTTIIFSILGIIPIVGWICILCYYIALFFCNWSDAKAAVFGQVTDRYSRPLV